MFCKNCGGEIDNGSSFCPYCGIKTETASVPAQRAEPASQPEPVYKEPAANYAADNSYAADNGYADRAGYNQGYEQSFGPAPVRTKKKSKAPLIIVAIIAVIGFVAGVLFATGAFTPLLSKLGITSPVYEVFEAAKKTLFETQSATVDITGDGEDNRLEISFGDGVDDLTVYFEGDGEGYFGIADGTIYICQYGEMKLNDVLTMYLGNSVPESSLGEMNDALDSLVSGKIDEETVKLYYNDGLREVFNMSLKMQYLYSLSESEMNKYIDTETYTVKIDEIPVNVDIPDYDTVMELVKEFLTRGLSEDTVEIKKEGSTYKYKIDVAEFLDSLADFIENNEILSNLISDISVAIGEDEAEFYEELRDEADDAREYNTKIKGKVEIEKGYLTYIDASADGEDLFSISLSKINETTVDKDNIEAIDTQDPYEDYYGDYY